MINYASVTSSTGFWPLCCCHASLVTYPAHRHLIGGQGSSLVRADDRCTAKGLHRRQTADNSVFLGHASSS